MKNLWAKEDADNFFNQARRLGVSRQLADCVYASRLLGRETQLVQHGGGNTSCKTTQEDIFGNKVEVLCIKGSGWDLDNKNAPIIAKMCEDEGADGVTVHWRTRADKYGGERELDTIAEVVNSLTIPVIANGDVLDIPSAISTLRHTGCAGLMIGRGAIRNPWVFRQLQQHIVRIQRVYARLLVRCGQHVQPSHTYTVSTIDISAPAAPRSCSRPWATRSRPSTCRCSPPSSGSWSP